MDLGFQATIDYGGLGRYSIGLLKELSTYCESITVYPTPLSVEEPTSHEWWDSMPDNITLEPKRNLISSSLRDLIRFNNHDIIHINYASLGVPALGSKILSGTPFVYTAHHYDQPKEIATDNILKWKYYIDLHLAFPIMASNGELVTVSNHNRNRIQNDWGYQP